MNINLRKSLTYLPIIAGLVTFAARSIDEKLEFRNNRNDNASLELRVEKTQLLGSNHQSIQAINSNSNYQSGKITTNTSDMNMSRLYDDIKMYEGGAIPLAYPDPRGFMTIGAGFNLDKVGARERITALGLSYDDVYNKKVSLTDEQINLLMKEDVDIAIDDAKVYLGKSVWDKISPDAREIIVNIAYTRGRHYLMKFRGVKKALSSLDYQRAADEIEWENPDAKRRVHTRWYNRTGIRAKELIDRMRILGR